MKPPCTFRSCRNQDMVYCAGGRVVHLLCLRDCLGWAALLQSVQTAIDNTVAFPLTRIAVAHQLDDDYVDRGQGDGPGTIIANAVTAVENYINNLAIG